MKINTLEEKKVKGDATRIKLRNEDEMLP